MEQQVEMLEAQMSQAEKASSDDGSPRGATELNALQAELKAERPDADLRPLSVEQRGTLWRAIARKSQLEMGRPVVMPTRQ